MPCPAARHPAYDDHAAGEKSDRDAARLTIVAPRIVERERLTFEYQPGIKKIEAALAQGSLALRRIEGDAPCYIVYTRRSCVATNGVNA